MTNTPANNSIESYANILSHRRRSCLREPQIYKKTVTFTFTTHLCYHVTRVTTCVSRDRFSAISLVKQSNLCAGQDNASMFLL